MAEIQELHRSLDLSSTEGIESFSAEDALSERIREWLETPQGSVADCPEWGNRLGKYKFSVSNGDFAMAMEMDIVNDLPRDVENITVQGIQIEERSIDLIGVNILCNGSILALEYNKGAA